MALRPWNWLMGDSEAVDTHFEKSSQAPYNLMKILLTFQRSVLHDTDRQSAKMSTCHKLLEMR
jgi:hypothetical protein